VLSAAASTVLMTWLSVRVGTFRKAARVPYPNAYASEAAAQSDARAYAFNCAHRAQANTTENYAPFVVSLLVAGLWWPKTAAVLGAAWTVARVMFAVGYTRSTPGDGGKGRKAGMWWAFPMAALQLLALGTGASFVWESLAARRFV
jgi:glutathione S-transferase